METNDAIGLGGTIALVISLFRDGAFLGLLKDIFVKPHHPDDLIQITQLQDLNSKLTKEKEIAEAISIALDNPENHEKAEKVRSVIRSRGIIKP